MDENVQSNIPSELEPPLPLAVEQKKPYGLRGVIALAVVIILVGVIVLVFPKKKPAMPTQQSGTTDKIFASQDTVTKGYSNSFEDKTLLNFTSPDPEAQKEALAGFKYGSIITFPYIVSHSDIQTQSVPNAIRQLLPLYAQDITALKLDYIDGKTGYLVQGTIKTTETVDQSYKRLIAITKENKFTIQSGLYNDKFSIADVTADTMKLRVVYIYQSPGVTKFIIQGETDK